MAANILVVSDLHLGDGDPVIENWLAPQQAAFETMLAATGSGGALEAQSVELVLNGDSFDFILARPAIAEARRTDVNVAHAKWARIVAAHGPFFAALREFLRVPGRRLTIIIGNHDLELYYPSIRARVRSAIGAPPGTVRFCLTQAYRPLPDVVIDHGCQIDAWNAIPTIWQGSAEASTPSLLETGDGLSGPVGSLALPWGSQFYYRVNVPVKSRYPFIDGLLPSLGLLQQVALVCLLAPDMLRERLQSAMGMIPAENGAVSALRSRQTEGSADLFALAIESVGAISQLVLGQPDEAEAAATMSTALHLANALMEAPDAALCSIITMIPPDTYTLAEAIPLAYQALLEAHPRTRIAIFGHTHEEGRWYFPNNQTLLNTGTWYPRLVAPRPEEWSGEFARWFASPERARYPGRDGARFTMAWLRSEAGAATVAELIAWTNEGFTAFADEGLSTF